MFFKHIVCSLVISILCSFFLCSFGFSETIENDTTVTRIPDKEVLHIEHFNEGRKGTEPKTWQVDSGIGMYYGEENSYAFLTRTAIATDDEFGYATLNSGYTFDVDKHNLLEIRVAIAAVESWKLSISQNPEGPYTDLIKNCTAPGTFTFNLSERFGWSGFKEIYLRIGIADKPDQYLKLDYWAIFRDSNLDGCEWRDDFIGPAGQANESWMPFAGTQFFYTGMTYTSKEAGVQLTKLSGTLPKASENADWGKILAPTIDLNLYNTPYIVAVISNVTIGTQWKMTLRQNIAGGKFLELGNGKTYNKSGKYTFDARDCKLWNDTEWKAEHPIFAEFIIEGEAGDSVTIETIRFLRETEISVDPDPDINTCAVPNPFLPHSGQDTFFYFDRPISATTFTVKIFNLKGQLVRTMIDIRRWDGKNQSGKILESGLYIYQIELPDKTHHGTVVLIK